MSEGRKAGQGAKTHVRTSNVSSHQVLRVCSTNRVEVYDRFVSRAVGTKSEEPGERMVEFYRELEQKGFHKLATQVQQALDEVNLALLPDTRVLDKLMMLSAAATGSAMLREDIVHVKTKVDEVHQMVYGISIGCRNFEHLPCITLFGTNQPPPAFSDVSRSFIAVLSSTPPGPPTHPLHFS